MPLLVYLILEIAVVLLVGSWIGVGWTLLALVASTVIGVLIARREGLRALGALRGRGGGAPELTDGLLIGLGGLLFVIPGFLSDLLGLILLLPPTRRAVRNRMLRGAGSRVPGLRMFVLRPDGTVGAATVVDGSVVDPSSAPTPGGAANGSATRILPARPAGRPAAAGGSVIDGSVIDGSIDEPPATSTR
ncbi:FxsA family protein [Nakamurella flava]|uniref:FxsA family protein n=1 Tax=Nakamurella flava TaxID=2576308 RepID=A0A4U6QK87_9ACTN|nr:FxsA family protein [Nakamurella flava]TKV60669.1 FxsA family protein [Nakamurella flava]